MPTVFANGLNMKYKKINDVMVLDHSKWNVGGCYLLKCRRLRQRKQLSLDILNFRCL